MRPLSRRDLLLLAAAGIATPAGTTTNGTASGGALVGLGRLDPGRVTPGTAAAALEAALVGATGAGSGAAAIAALFHPGDVVGIKVNALAGRALSPRVQTVEALAALLRHAGVAPSHVIVFDRSSRELRRAGYPTGDAGGWTCRGIDNDYDATPSESGAIGSCFARLVSTTCTALISLGVVKDHDLSGVSVGAKNWYGVIHNPNKYHDNGCDPYLADLLRHPYLRSKVRLTIADGAVAQCHGGPAYRSDATFPLGLVAASTDLLACDAWGWKVIEAERRRRGLRSLDEEKRAPRFLATATRLGLGEGDPARVREVLG